MKHEPISELRRYAADLEASVSIDRSRAAARQALLTSSTSARRPRRAIVAILATTLMGVSNVAFAAVANPAAPGDTLYGVDRAYESLTSVVGLGGTHATERALEVQTLLDRGKSSEALQHVIETLTQLVETDDPVAAVEEFTAGLGRDGRALALALAVAREGTYSGPDIAAIATEFARLNLPDQAQGNPGGPSERPPADPGNPNPGNPNSGAGTPGQPPRQGGG